jgi:hypothetical protein
MVDLNAGTVRAPVTSGVWGTNLSPIGVALRDAADDTTTQVLLLARSTAYALNKTTNAGAAAATAQDDIGKNLALYRTTGSVTTTFVPTTETAYVKGVSFRGDIAEPVGNSGGYIYCALLTPLF